MANYFMQGGDGKEYGPVSAEQLRQWAAEGRANAQTQVRLAEGGSYMVLGAVPELNAAGVASGSGYAPSFAQPSSEPASALSGPGANYFMQGGDGKEYGPVSAEQLRQWVREGRANAQTQVRLAEGGTYQALGSVPELNAAGAASASLPQPGPSLAHTLAQNSGQAGGDSSQLIKRLAVILTEAGGWMKFLAILSFLSGAGMVFGPGIVICWLPIWLGVVLWKAAAKAQEAAFTGSEADMIGALDQLRFYFKLTAIYRIIMFVVMIVFIIVFFGMIMAFVGSAGAGAGGHLGNLFQ
jgi:hypothetical protein